MGIQASIKFTCLFGRERRFITFLRDAFPQDIDQFYSLCERKALYGINQVRTHV